jgi:hypothetical protein
MFVGMGAFLVFDQKFVQTAKAHKTFFRSPHSFVWFGTLFTLRLSLSFRSSRRRQQRDDLFSRSSRLALLRSAQNVSSFSRGKRWKIIYSFCAPKKESSFLPSSSVVVVFVWSLLFYNYLWIIFARAPWASSRSLLFFYCLLVVQSVESSSSGGFVFSCCSFFSLSLTRALFHHS